MLIGAIVGDIAGSKYERNRIKYKNFELFQPDDRFTDDTIMTLAVAKSLLESGQNFENLGEIITKNIVFYAKKYPNCGFGHRFREWMGKGDFSPYNSFGNGSAMRVSAVPYFAKTETEVKKLAKIVSETTHNHPEGVKGAEAVAMAIWLALHKKSKQEISDYIEKNYYNLQFDYDDLIKNYKFDSSCQGSVPQSIFAFLISNSFEDAIKTAISMGGDSDTMASIAGAIAEAFYGVPSEIEAKALTYLDADLLKIYKDVNKHFSKK